MLQSDPKDSGERFPIIEPTTIQNNEGFTIPNLPITIDPEKLIDKQIFYKNQKGYVKERINDTDYRITYDIGKRSTTMGYDEIIRQLTHISPDDNDERWELEDIIGHRWTTGKKKKLEVLIKWKDFDKPEWIPMNIIKEDDPVTLAEYARDNDLLDHSQWKWATRYLLFSKTAKDKIRHIYAIRKAKSINKYKFGDRI